MKKICVIGSPGSGKSTFSKLLSTVLNIPVTHLDLIYWNSDESTVSDEEFDSRLSETMSKESWIIDGHYSRTLQIRLKACDTIFFLDYPLDICLDGYLSRQNQIRSDIPWIEFSIDEDFIEYIKDFHKNEIPQLRKALNNYKQKVITFHSRAEGDDYLKSL